MTEQTSATITDALVELLGSIAYMDTEDRAQASLESMDIFEDARVSTYADRMLLTRDDGLVVRLADGSEYQITIQRSR